MSYLLTTLDTIVKRHIEEKIFSSFVQNHVLLYILMGNDVEAKAKLGQPGTPVVIGGKSLGLAQKMQHIGDRERHVRYQIVNPAETAVVGYRGAKPASALWAEDAWGTAATRWTHHTTPFRVSKDALMMAKNEYEIGSVIEDAVKPGINSHLAFLQNNLWNGTLTGAQQTAQNMWTSYLGLDHTINQNNFYGQVDRSVQTRMNSLVLAGGGITPTLRLIRQVNIVNNIAGRSSNGKGIDLVITTPELWMILADEAEGRWQITVDGIKDHAFAGFEKPMIRYDHTWIVADTDCPHGCMYMLHTPSWLFEFNPAGNFSLKEWVDNNKVVEGGGCYFWSEMDSIGRLTCTEPWLQVRICGLAETTGESLSSSSSIVTGSSSSSQSTSSPSSQSTSSLNSTTSVSSLSSPSSSLGESTSSQALKSKSSSSHSESSQSTSSKSIGA